MLEHVSYDIILELCELARNMSWPDGLVYWFGFGMVMGSNFGGANLILFLFLLKKIGMEWIRRGGENPSRKGHS